MFRRSRNDARRKTHKTELDHQRILEPLQQHALNPEEYHEPVAIELTLTAWRWLLRLLRR